MPFVIVGALASRLAAFASCSAYSVGPGSFAELGVPFFVVSLIPECYLCLCRPDELCSSTRRDVGASLDFPRF